MPASSPQMMNWLQRRSTTARAIVTTATSALVNSWTRMKLAICALISSRISTVSFFCQSVRPGDLDDLLLVEIAGDQEEVDEKEDHRRLAGRRRSGSRRPRRGSCWRRTPARRPAPWSDRRRSASAVGVRCRTRLPRSSAAPCAAFWTWPIALSPCRPRLVTRSRIRCAACGTCATICSAWPGQRVDGRCQGTPTSASSDDARADRAGDAHRARAPRRTARGRRRRGCRSRPEPAPPACTAASRPRRWR